MLNHRDKVVVHIDEITKLLDMGGDVVRVDHDEAGYLHITTAASEPFPGSREVKRGGHVEPRFAQNVDGVLRFAGD